MNQATVTPRLFALLVGIDKYLAQNDLSGCVNDVEAMRIMLMNRYAVPEDHLRVLTNEQATRVNILKAFEKFLINNIDIRRGDQILFHYSGHGSQMAARPEDYEPDGLNETIVPHDSRTADVFDIPDKTLAALLDRLAAAKGDQITVILDSCHSGSGTRRPEDPSAPRVRRVPADSRIPPADLDADLRAGTGAGTRAAGPSGWASAELPYVLLAGCRDREESNEYQGKLEDATVWHGALTYFTLKTLRDLPERATYAELHERVAALVNTEYPRQMPQCEGARDRQIFSGVRVERDPFIAMQRVSPDGTTVTLGAGLVHGLRPGTRLALYPPEIRTRAELPQTPLVTVEVASVTATTAEAAVQGQPSQPISQHARAVITVQVYAGLRKTVRLDSDGDARHDDAIARLRRAIEHATADDKPSPYLQLEDDPAAPVDLVVKAEGGHVGVYNDTGTLLVVPVPIADDAAADDTPRKIRLSLESIVRFRTIQGLSNDTVSQLNGKVRLGLRRYVKDADGECAEDLPQETVGLGGEISVFYDPDAPARNLYVVDVINASNADVYAYVFTLSPDYSIRQLHPPPGDQQAIRPNKDGLPYPIGLQRGTDRLELYLPDGWDASRDYVKAIVTTQPTDLRSLEQEGLEVPAPPPPRRGGPVSAIQELIDAVTFGERTRFGRPNRPVAGEDWTTAQLTINTIRKYQVTPLDAPAGRVAVSDELTLVKPEGFTGEVTVTTLGSATRGETADPGLKPPPGLMRFSGAFELIGRSGTRGLGSNGLVIALDVDEPSRRLITPDNPLRLELPRTRGGDTADLLPIIFDGEDYLLAGYGIDGGNAVDLVSLPRPVAPAEGQPTKRGLARTLRLFIFKKLGRYTTDIGLRRAELRDGAMIYSPVRRDGFQPGQRVALFVHGFVSDTRWMIEYPAQFLQAEVARYDHLLTWDYETFGTSVEENGAQLAQALKQQCGFGPDDGITVDIYAHSMGTLVTRCMVELSGGHAFVDRAVLAGPPNRGSTLASTGRLLTFLVTELVNRASVVPIIGAATWTVKQLFEQGVALADLAVDSPVSKRLNALEVPSNVPYLVLAGENLPDPAERSRLNRLAHKVLDSGLDAMFGEQNDIAIGLSSMQGLRGGDYPNLTTAVLPCDHFHYFVLPEGQQAIKCWASTDMEWSSAP
jgi:hypothetical protein